METEAWLVKVGLALFIKKEKRKKKSRLANSTSKGFRIHASGGLGIQIKKGLIASFYIKRSQVEWRRHSRTEA